MSKEKFPQNLIIDTIRWILGWVIRLGIIGFALILILPAITFLIGGVSAEVEIPVLKQLAKTSFIFEGGARIPPEFMALVLALSLYTATFVAECVRAGIEGISKSTCSWIEIQFKDGEANKVKAGPGGEASYVPWSSAKEEIKRLPGCTPAFDLKTTKAETRPKINQ